MDKRLHFELRIFQFSSDWDNVVSVTSKHFCLFFVGEPAFVIILVGKYQTTHNWCWIDLNVIILIATLKVERPLYLHAHYCTELVYSTQPQSKPVKGLHFVECHHLQPNSCQLVFGLKFSSVSIFGSVVRLFQKCSVQRRPKVFRYKAYPRFSHHQCKRRIEIIHNKKWTRGGPKCRIRQIIGNSNLITYSTLAPFHWTDFFTFGIDLSIEIHIFYRCFRSTLYRSYIRMEGPV